MFPEIFNLEFLNGTNGFTVTGINTGAEPGSSLGTSVSSAGDINNDGITDVIMGAPNALCGNYFDDSVQTECKGQSYVIFGSTNKFTANFDLNNLNGTNGFTVNGINYCDASGSSVSGIGDFNGDNIDDILIGAPGTLCSYSGGSGQSYIIFGSSTVFPAQFELSKLNGTNGFALNGVGNEISGSYVNDAGDFNGDGLADVLIGAPNGGKCYVVFGNKGIFSSEFELKNLNGTNGFAINGINHNDFSGSSVSSAGDFNNDGLDDILIGALGATGGAMSSGQSYVIFGSKEKFPAEFHLQNLNGINGFVINSNVYMDNIGSSVSNIGDINGDGINDISIGALGGWDTSVGRNYIVLGSKSSFGSTFNLEWLDGSNGFIINGYNKISHYYGFLLGKAAGDFNNDNISDIIIGDQYALSSTGQAYLLLSENIVPSVSPTPSSTPSTTATATASLTSSPTQTPSQTPSPTAMPTPSQTASPSPSTPIVPTKDIALEATVASVGGAIVLVASVGLFMYGKAHGWWCSGESSSADLTQPLNAGVE